MSVRWWSLLVWALVGASAVFWALQLWAWPHGLPPQTAVAAPPDLLQTSLARLAGTEGRSSPAVAAAPSSDGRFALVGVVSPAAGGRAPVDQAAAPTDATRAPSEAGLALISVGGKPPRAFAVGEVVEGGLVLQAVSRRSASLGPIGQEPRLQLSIPEPAAPERGGLLAATPDGAPGTLDGRSGPEAARAAVPAGRPARP